MIFINRRWNLYQNNMGFNLNTNLQYSAAYKSNILHICGILTSWSVAVRPTNGETVNSQGAGSAQAPTNPHSNGRIK